MLRQMFAAKAFYRSHNVEIWRSSAPSAVRRFLLCIFAADFSTLSLEVQAATRVRMCAGTERAWASMEVWRTARVHVQVSRHFEKHLYVCVDIHNAKTVETPWAFSRCTQTNKQIQKIKTFTIHFLTCSTLHDFVCDGGCEVSAHEPRLRRVIDWFSRLFVIPLLWNFLKNWVTCHISFLISPEQLTPCFTLLHWLR